MVSIILRCHILSSSVFGFAYFVTFEIGVLIFNLDFWLFASFIFWYSMQVSHLSLARSSVSSKENSGFSYLLIRFGLSVVTRRGCGCIFKSAAAAFLLSFCSLIRGVCKRPIVFSLARPKETILSRQILDQVR